jgi:hypothetical protein
MQHRSKLLVASLAAAIVLSLAVGTAGARRLEVSNQRFREIFTSLEIRNNLSRVLCPVTYMGSFHSRTFSKVNELLIGYLIRVQTAASCTGGSARALTETLPWHIRFLGFLGVLPRIDEIHWILIDARWRWATPEGIACLFHTTVAHPGSEFVHVEAGGRATSVRADELVTIPVEGLCALGETARLSGTGEVVAAEGTPELSYRLVQ